MNTDAGQWLIQGNDVANGSLSSHIAGDPQVVQLRRIASDVVVLAMPADRAAELRARFGNRLVIEPNSELIPPMS
jgi:hypothetical protein